ncbi:hypothetical protein POM88_033069 [Heracleum sosnowskyi]|uniref:Uncharacterized protein n=1 Tax=Heracleum sosnowskyi TaxID=360622 RepID=A0AAD8MKP6_9APIA|nr:hypothetical protein POM88_033069 [Heracleum sosnowskyi]
MVKESLKICEKKNGYRKGEEDIDEMFRSPGVHETTTSIPVTKTNSNVNSTPTRQSQRLKNLACLAEDRQIEVDNEPIDLDESEREDVLEIVEIDDEPIPCDKSLEEKVDQLVEDVEMLKSKINETDFSSDRSSELNYKILYIRSQKKIQSLAFENGKLSNQLLIARAKIEKHENGKDYGAKLMEVLESNLTKATEALVKLSSQAVFPVSTSQPDRVKRCNKRKKGEILKNCG